VIIIFGLAFPDDVGDEAARTAAGVAPSVLYQFVLENPGLELTICTKVSDVPELALLYDVSITMLLVPFHVNGDEKTCETVAGRPAVGIVCVVGP
jgi:hypothetical protein